MKVQSEQYVINNKIKKKVSSESETELSKSGSDIFINNAEFQKRASFQRIQNGKASFVNVQLLDEDENEIQFVEYEQNVILRMAIEIFEDIDVLGFGYLIRNKNGIEVAHSGSYIENKKLQSVKKGERYIIDCRFKASLQHGNYNVVCTLAIPINIEISKAVFCDFVTLAFQFVMEPRRGGVLHGLVHLDNKIEIYKY